MPTRTRRKPIVLSIVLNLVLAVVAGLYRANPTEAQLRAKFSLPTGPVDWIAEETSDPGGDRYKLMRTMCENKSPACVDHVKTDLFLDIRFHDYWIFSVAVVHEYQRKPKHCVGLVYHFICL